MEGYDEWLEAPAHWVGKYDNDRDYLRAYMGLSGVNDVVVQHCLDIPRTTDIWTYVYVLTSEQLELVLNELDVINEVENDDE